ncbi:MAG TPA: rhodanese-like domain-containing protein [Acidimicrobiia bacterium]|nr:rhodanese-like domain-containing protein [Acidimicrobiia bacterium]
MRRGLLGLMVIGLVACSGSTAVIEKVDPATASTIAAQPGTIVLDIRTPEEFAAGHLTGAIDVDFYATDFADRIGALDHAARYVVYCHTGNRSGQAMDLFRQDGFTDVHEIDGGIAAWVAAGLPITTG